MPYQDAGSGDFYKFAMTLFFESGHTLASEPIFWNHSARNFLYFDVPKDVPLTAQQRKSFGIFEDVSMLFTANYCDFFSMSLLTKKGDRSQAAHEIHSMIHPRLRARASICLFRWEDAVMFTFAGFGRKCILSDWYSMYHDDEVLKEKLDIGNMGIKSGREYFDDFVYGFARSYYMNTFDAPVYALIPADSFKSIEEIDREALNECIRNLRQAPLQEYGEDYVEYEETTGTVTDAIEDSLEVMILDLDDLDDLSGENPFGEEIEEETLEDEEEEEETEEETLEKDEYEFEDVDPAIFQDPALMVKWLNKNSQTDDD